jgi:NADPH:quinone reductase-like Zn-dependent oxidoreductase
MNAIVLHEHGGVEKLVLEENFPIPAISNDEVLVRVKATSVNRIDFFIRSGYPGIEIPFPHIPGADIAGEVAEVGSDVTAFREGDRVLSWPLIACGDCEYCMKNQRGLCLNWKYFGMHIDGSYAEYVRAPAASLIPLPKDISYEDAATLPVAGLTAYHAFTSVGQLRKGETALIWGGSGGLGTFAVQIAKELGAQVITSVGKDEKKEKLQELGADLVINHHTEDAKSAIHDFTKGAGIEVVLDSVGAETFPTGFMSLKKGGRLLLCGKLTGMDVELSLHLTYLRHVSIMGLYLGEKHELIDLLRWVQSGRVKPAIDRVIKLEDVADAHEAMARGEHLGKIVLTP